MEIVTPATSENYNYPNPCDSTLTAINLSGAVSNAVKGSVQSHGDAPVHKFVPVKDLKNIDNR